MAREPEFYEKLKTLLNSGIDLMKALDILQSREKSRRGFLSKISESIASGDSLADALEKQDRHFTPFEASLIRSGEITGNLEKNLEFLCRYLGRIRRWKTKILTGLIYPLILLHAAVFLPPLPVLIMDGFRPYIGAVYRPILYLYSLFFLLFALKKITGKSKTLSGTFDILLWKIPVAGRISRNLALARFLKSLGLGLKAGLGAEKALRVSSASASNATIIRALSARPRELLENEGITGVIRHSGLLSGGFLDVIYTGEESGTVDDALLYVSENLEQEADVLMQRAAIVLPLLLYIAVAVYIGYIIISFYAGLYGDIIAF